MQRENISREVTADVTLLLYMGRENYKIHSDFTKATESNIIIIKMVTMKMSERLQYSSVNKIWRKLYVTNMLSNNQLKKYEQKEPRTSHMTL